jgi:hypothetical protein
MSDVGMEDILIQSQKNKMEREHVKGRKQAEERKREDRRRPREERMRRW